MLPFQKVELILSSLIFLKDKLALRLFYVLCDPQGGSFIKGDVAPATL